LIHDTDSQCTAVTISGRGGKANKKRLVAK
jgi:hypothetical protein